VAIGFKTTVIVLLSPCVAALTHRCAATAILQTRLPYRPRVHARGGSKKKTYEGYF